MKKLNLFSSILVLLSGCLLDNGLPVPVDETSFSVFYQGTGTTYYISSSIGDDFNTGLSPANAWQTIGKLNDNLLNFTPGDTILFKSGDVFRGFLEPAVGTSSNWIKYSSYSSGEKPLIIGSIALNQSSDWTNHSGNIWKTTSDTWTDIGGIFMNGDYSAIGERKWDINSLLLPGDFYFDPSGTDKRLYLYTSITSPADYYSDIEASLRKKIISLNQRSYILFEGLHLNKGAAQGFGGSNSQYIIIKDCDFSYIGGGFLRMDAATPVRYGNGIEFWGNAQHNWIDSNKFWEIYDTAVTNQNRSSTSIQKYLYYTNNIIRNCGLASFELWNRPADSEMSHIYFLNNTSINPGHGWGGSEHRSDKNSFHIASFYNEAQGDNLVIKNNIFYSSATPIGAIHHLFFFDENINGGYSHYVIDNNLWEMPDPAWALTTSTLYSSLSDWQSINNQSINGLTGDPLFTDFSNNDFSLQKASPAINHGTNTLRQVDFYGNQIIGNPDMGAIEYQ